MVLFGFLDLLDFYLEKNQDQSITSNAFDKDSTRRKSALRDIYSTQMSIHDVQSSRYQARQRRHAGRHQAEIIKLGYLIRLNYEINTLIRLKMESCSSDQTRCYFISTWLGREERACYRFCVCWELSPRCEAIISKSPKTKLPEKIISRFCAVPVPEIFLKIFNTWSRVNSAVSNHLATFKCDWSVSNLRQIRVRFHQSRVL